MPHRDVSTTIDHDAAKFEITRDRVPNTPRYDPVAPLLVFALLSGCRRAEILGLNRRDIDLEAGEIKIRAASTKTRPGRNR